MKRLFLILPFVIAMACNQAPAPNLTVEEVLEQTILKHDPQKKWSQWSINVHIQEPRIQNPYRYSIVKWNNSAPTFEMIRNREEHTAKYIVDKGDNSKVLLDGSENIDTALVRKYLLDPARSKGYRGYYKVMFGLPMVLDSDIVKTYNGVSKVFFNNEACYKLELELKEPMISKFWNVFFDEKDFSIKGLELVDPNEPGKGERLYFDQAIEINGITIPRMHHWHDLKDDSYLGSDIIVNDLSE